MPMLQPNHANQLHQKQCGQQLQSLCQSQNQLHQHQLTKTRLHHLLLHQLHQKTQCLLRQLASRKLR